jgi:hypothetical protein
MKRRLTQTFLVIAISLFIALFSAYHVYLDLVDADFFSSDINFGNSDQENPLADQHNESKIFLSGTFSIRFSPPLGLLEQLPLLPFITWSLDQKASILRC